MNDLEFLSLSRAWPTHVENHQAHVHAHWLFHWNEHRKRHRAIIKPKPIEPPVSESRRLEIQRANAEERFIDECGCGSALW